MGKVINRFVITFLFLICVNGLMSQSQSELPESIQQFAYTNTQEPFGVPHKDAHSEIKAFEKLTGVWLCETHALFQGQWYSGWHAYWTFKYILDGFAIEDLWYQLEENLSPPLKYLERNYAGINIRIYDYSKEKVTAFWAQNRTPNEKAYPSTSTFEGNFANGEFKMMKSDSTRRITFYNITGSSFDWMAETYVDSSDSWQATLKITAERVK